MINYYYKSKMKTVFTVVFASGSRWYTKIPAGDNIIGRFCGCVWVCMVL